MREAVSLRIVGFLRALLGVAGAATIAMCPQALSAQVTLAVNSAQVVAPASVDPTGKPIHTGDNIKQAPAELAPELLDYKLGVADHVRVNVYNEPDLSGEFTVSSTGSLSLPLIGSVLVAGKTASEAANSIQGRLLGRYLKDPHVSLEVLVYRPFFILGEVTKPGEYPYANGLTILNAVATAEGFTYRANKRRAFVKRSGQNSEQRVEIAPDTLVQPGDTIRIGARHF